MATAARQGQITLPKQDRDVLCLVAGSRVSFDVQSGQVILRTDVPEHVLGRWRGYLRERSGSQSTDDVMEESRGA